MDAGAPGQRFGGRALTEPLQIGGVRLPNRVVLAPLAGIGNWFVRLQARRFGAGLVTSEMVSSHAIHYGNERTLRELLRIHPDERTAGPTGGGPVSFQLFGCDPDVMRSAAGAIAALGADLLDINMGCPVSKVTKTGAGAALLADPRRAVAVARATAEGSGLPVTVKLRCGLRSGDTSGFELARRLVEDAGVAAVAFHPRTANVAHRGTPDYELTARLVEVLPVPVIVSGGCADRETARGAYERSGAAAVMLARGSLGNPWLFAQLLGARDGDPSPAEVLAELEWVLDRAEEHFGPERAARYLRKFYPWYLVPLGVDRAALDAFQRSEDLGRARALIGSLMPVPAA